MFLIECLLVCLLESERLFDGEEGGEQVVFIHAVAGKYFVGVTAPQVP
jgi:hypothetical protein